MYLKIWKVKIIEWKYWNNMLITHLWLYDENGKRIKWIKMDQYVADFITWFPIIMNWDMLENIKL